MFAPENRSSPGRNWLGLLQRAFRRLRRVSRQRRRSQAGIAASLERLEERCLLSVVAGDIGDGGFIVSTSGPLSDFTDQEPVQIATSYLQQHYDDLGLTSTDVANVVVTDSYTTEASGQSYVYMRQTHNGIPVIGGELNFTILRDGRLLSVGNRAVPALVGEVIPGAASVTAQGAISIAANYLQIPLTSGIQTVSAQGGVQSKGVYSAPSLSADDITAELDYFNAANFNNSPDDRVHLSWRLVIRVPDGSEWGEFFVDAQTGSMLTVASYMNDASPNPVLNSGTYNTVDVPPAESPIDGPRVLVVNPADSTASPFGWHDTNGIVGAEFTDTRGNNVSAQEDTDANNAGGFRPNGVANLGFNIPFNTYSDPTADQSTAIANLFFVNNITHDIHYQYGFDEASGNFQFNNYGNGGLGNDAVQADAQDGSGTNNANFATPPDGVAPRMQQFIFDINFFTGQPLNPRLDSDLDNGVIIHEYGHGVSNRLTGGPANSFALFALQSGGMGEGWSDWWALMLTQRATDQATDAFPIGNYVLAQLPSGPGIRRFPYSFNMAIDPLTLGRFNGDLFPQQNNSEVHNSGEIWASALWDMNWLLVKKYGFDSNLYRGYQAGGAGNLLAMQLVMDGLKIQPVFPSFIDARDAILAADIALTGGQNQFEIWTAFARRGFGLSASDGGSANSLVVVEAFDIPFTVIKGSKFNDLNGNGLRGGLLEVGLPGWTIYLDQNANGVRDLFTQTYPATGLPQIIRDTTTINVPVTVAGTPGFVQDVNVTLDITHPYDADMDVFLIAPSGKKVELFTDVGSNLANFTNTTLDDSAPVSITGQGARAPFTGTFRPEGRLSDFIGENPNGVWTLQVIDDAPRDTGRLNSWSLQLSAGENFTITDTDGDYNLIVPGAGTYTVAEELQLGWRQTGPAAPGTYTLTMNTFDVFTGQDFGNQASADPNPVLVFPTLSSTYLENGPPLPIDSKAIVTDANSVTFSGGVLTVTNSVNATVDDRLEITNQGTVPGGIGIAGSNVTFGGVVIGTFTGGVGASPLLVSFNTSATAPIITALLRQITFRVVSDTPSELPRTIVAQVTDGAGGISNIATTQILVVAQNDAPVNTVPAGTSTVLRNVSFVFTGLNTVSFADPDLGILPLLVTLTAANGTVSLASTTGLNFIVGDGTADPTMSFTGISANINAALAGLSFTSNPGYIGAASITISSNDQGASGAGGPLIDTDIIAVSVVNLPPTLTSIGALNGAVEDTDFIITHSALALVADDADPNFDPLPFRIEAVTGGTLTKNGLPVIPQVTALGPNESLTWRPAANANGLLPAFTVRVTDGTFFTDPPVQVTVNVSPVADAPTLTTVVPLSKAAATFPFTISYNQLASAANEVDVDNESLVFRIEAVNSGSLTSNTLPVVPGLTTVGLGESLVWTPIAGTSGTIDAFTIIVVDPTGLPSTPPVNVPIVTVISTPPTLTSVGTLSSAQRNGFIDITHDLLRSSSNAFDPEGDSLTFRVESVVSGGLSKNGISVVPGVTTLAPGETLRYTPIVGTTGVVDAFTITATDGVFFTTPSVNVQVNVVNTAPTLSTIGTLGGASEDLAFTITQPMIGAASDDADFNGDTVNFVIASVLSGTLTRNGLPVVPGVTVLDAANAVVWTPAPNANGVLNAFTVVATDGNLSSTNPVTVAVNVTPVNDAPTMSLVNTIINGIETLPFDFTHQILSDASDEADIDNSTVSFRVEAVLSGTLLKDGVQVIQGQTSVGPNEKFVWIPSPGALGRTPAFLVRAFDGLLPSATPLTVTLDISPLGLTRMYRSYNPNADYHFFTLSTGEFSSAVRHGYLDESSGRPGYAVPVLQLAGTTAIHRMRNPYNGRHYYTASDFERDFLRKNGWVYEKDEGNIFNQPVSGSVEVFRLYNTRTGSHLFTEVAATKDAILALFPGVWVQHASLGYAFSQSATTVITSPPANPASVRSGISASVEFVTSEPPTTIRARSVIDSPTVNAGLLGSPTVSISPSITVSPTIGTTASGEPTRNPLRSARDARQLDQGTGLLDQVWSEVGLELILETSQLIDSGD
ncbi:MAG: M36 family metallopeptidase [Planctomycetales bacterium]|nr:M36 family metallopeptidase [Planctomycetales bacterium]